MNMVLDETVEFMRGELAAWIQSVVTLSLGIIYVLDLVRGWPLSKAVPAEMSQQVSRHLL